MGGVQSGLAMALYSYRCPNGHPFNSFTRSDSERCPVCSTSSPRRFAFSVLSSFQDHYNHAAGEYVRNRREFEDSLKRQSDEHSERTGIPHEYVPIPAADMVDPSSVGADPTRTEKAYRTFESL